MIGAALLALAGCDRGDSVTAEGAGEARAAAGIDRAEGRADAAATAKAGLRGATQVAARVNGREITVHQVNDRIGALSALPASAARETAAQPRQALDHLIDLALVGQAAEAAGLDRDPQVLRQLQAARQEVIARAWAQQVSDDETPPTAEEVRRFYDEHPDWFARHRVYVLHELRADLPAAQRQALWPQIQPLIERPGSGRGRGEAPEAAREIGRLLERQGVAWTAGTVQRGSEQLPPAVLEPLSRAQPGQALALPEEAGLRVWWLQAVQEQPLAWAQARPLIERQLWGQRRTERTRQEIQRLREQARIEFEGEFAAPGAGAAISADAR